MIGYTLADVLSPVCAMIGALIGVWIIIGKGWL